MQTSNSPQQEPVNLTALEAALREKLTAGASDLGEMEKLGVVIRGKLKNYAAAGTAAKTDMGKLQKALYLELIEGKVLSGGRRVEGTLNHAVKEAPITLIPESVAEKIRVDVQNRGSSIDHVQVEREIEAVVRRVCAETGKTGAVEELRLVVMVQIWRAIENFCRRGMGHCDPLGAGSLFE